MDKVAEMTEETDDILVLADRKNETLFQKYGRYSVGVFYPEILFQSILKQEMPVLDVESIYSHISFHS